MSAMLRTPKRSLAWSTVVGLSLVSLLLLPQISYAEYCLRTHPPKGMPKRCHSLKIKAPAIRPHLVDTVREWMSTCVQKSRVESLVTYTGLETVWSQIGPHRGHEFNLIPTYSPFKFQSKSRKGKTCYGIEGISFRVAEQRSAAAIDTQLEDIEISNGPREDQLKSAALRATPLVRNGNISSQSKSRLLCVLGRIERSGRRFDATYFDVEPQGKTNTGDYELPLACFTKGTYGKNGHTRTCKSIEASRSDCIRNFGDRLVGASSYGDREFLSVLEALEEKINRGNNYAVNSQVFGKGVMGRPFVNKVVIPAQLRSRKQQNLYGCY